MKGSERVRDSDCADEDKPENLRADIAEVVRLRHAALDDSEADEAAEGDDELRMFGDHRPARRAVQHHLTEGAEDVPYLVGGAGQGGYADVISPPSDQPLENGDILMLDTGATLGGYFCDFDRNFAIGKASDQCRRAHETLHRATEAALAIARPGRTCRDLFEAMAGVIGEGGGDVGRYGHGLGIQLTEPPSLVAFDNRVLEAGMVLTLEPGRGLG